MAFTYTDKNKKTVKAVFGEKVKVTLIDAVAVGDLLAAGATSATNAFRLADQSDGYAATLVAVQDGLSGAEIEAAFAAELETQPSIGDGGAVTDVYFAASTDFLGSPLYLGEDGKPASSAGGTTVQEVGKLLARNRIILVPGASVYAGAVTATTITASGIVSLASTLGVADTAKFAGVVEVSGAANLHSTLGVSGAVKLAAALEVSGATALHSTLAVSGAVQFASSLDVSGGSAFRSTLLVSGVLSLAGALDVSGVLSLSSDFKHVSEAKRVMVSGATVLAISDSGYRLECPITSTTLTLPPVTDVVAGICYRIINTAPNASGDPIVSPVSQDKIMGCGISGTDDVDVVLTKATSKKGDRLDIMSNGTTGWYISKMFGTWVTG